jgi:hypothetical protein
VSATTQRRHIEAGKIPRVLPPIRAVPEFYTYVVEMCEKENRPLADQFTHILTFYAEHNGYELPPRRVR